MEKNNKNYSDSVIVKYSDIHGSGIFTIEDIPAKAPIMIIEGDVISTDEALRREYEEGNVYIFWNGDVCIDTVRSEKIKYINHSCSPNCRVLGRSKKSLKLVSIGKIKSGEELTIDYAYDEIYEHCNCSKCSSKKMVQEK
jgi:SET domain-containing protein